MGISTRMPAERSLVGWLATAVMAAAAVGLLLNLVRITSVGKRRSRDRQMAKQGQLHCIQDKGEDDRGGKQPGDDGNGERRHQDAVGRQDTEDRQVDDRRQDQPSTRPRTPDVLPFTRDVKDGLATEYQCHHSHAAQRLGVQAGREFPGRQAGDAKRQVDHTHDNTGDGEIADMPDIRLRRWPDIIG
jgi:hypothetical protein